VGSEQGRSGCEAPELVDEDEEESEGKLKAMGEDPQEAKSNKEMEMKIRLLFRFIGSTLFEKQYERRSHLKKDLRNIFRRFPYKEPEPV
jgi:hypothetical protein